MTEDLRAKRNSLQRELSRRKSVGDDATELLLEMKQLSSQIKLLEKHKRSKNVNEKTISHQPILNSDIFFRREADYQQKKSKINCKIFKTNSAEYESIQTKLREVEAETKVFQQNQLPWILSWQNSINNSELVIVLFYSNAELVGFLWMQEKKIGPAKILTSAPPHFCDFHDMVLQNKIDFEMASDALFNCLKETSYDAIWLKNINSKSLLHQFAKSHNFAVISQSNIYSRSLSGNITSVDRLSSKMKYSLRSKRKKLEAKYGFGCLKLCEVRTLSEYDLLENTFANIYVDRWGVEIPIDARKRRRDALEVFLKTGDVRIFIFKISNEIVAYKIGFFYQQIFWEWKSCSRVELNDYSINDIFLADLMSFLTKKGMLAYNFMAGDYNYKKRWSDLSLTTENYEFFNHHTMHGRVLKILVALIRIWRAKRT